MNKPSNIENVRIFEKIMPLCLALFFCRTVFIGYKYLFFLTLVPSIAYSVYIFFKQKIAVPNLRILWLLLLVIFLFFIHFTPISNVIKESVNILLILYFVAFSKHYYTEDKGKVLLKWIVRLTSLVGCIAIIRFSLLRLGISLPLSSILFEGDSYSLVNDNNFYSLFFIVVIIITVWLYLDKQLPEFGFIIINTISFVNVVFSMSRRGYVLYALLIIAIILLIVFKYRGNKVLMFVGFSPIFLASSVLIGLLFFLKGMNKIDYYVLENCHKIYTLVDKGISLEEFELKLRMKRADKHQFASGDNLFYNGDLRYGLTEWGYIPTSHDCISFMLAEKHNENKIRVSNSCTSGYWQVYYAGRPIFYHKDVTYNLSFAYRVFDGAEQPFNVGWWVHERGSYKNNLPQKITQIDSVWKRCEVSYKFMQDCLNPACFLNSLQAGSTIEVKDISLTCDDTTGLPMYADQLPDSVIHVFFVKEGADTINYFTSPRTDRWRYALELWQTRYDTKQKIFGQGFKYLEWYGEKFYGNPKRYDFPHNPIISSFLYSGIIGGVVYIIFLIMSLWLYWKKRQKLGIFFIMYLCCMFFSMFSGSSHFSFPLFAFLSFLPFVETKVPELKRESA